MTDKPLREPWPSVVGWPYSCDNCGEKGECFTGCCLAECDAVAIRESRPTTPQDAEAVARHALDRCYEGAAERGGYDVSAYCEARDAYRRAVGAAVRAECAAKVLDAVTHENVVADLPVRGARPEVAEYVADVLLCVRKRIRKTLKEAP